MKNLIIMTVVFVASVQAHGNLIIPTCRLSEKVFSESNEELIKKLEGAEERGHKCESAKLNFALAERLGQREKILSTFDWLAKGHYLNDYTELLLNSNIDYTDKEVHHLLRNQVEMYIKLSKKFRKSTRMNSQFNFNGEALSFFDEIELNLSLYIRNYNDKLSSEVKKAIERIREVRLSGPVEVTKFHLKRNLPARVYNDDLMQIAQAFKRHPNMKKPEKTLTVMAKALIRSDIKDGRQAQLLNQMANLIDSPRQQRRFIKKFDIRFSSLNISSDEFLKEILKDSKGNRFNIKESLGDKLPEQLFELSENGDKNVFLPLNKKSENKKVKSLLALGAVGVLLTFDRQIMDTVQANQSETLDHIIEFTNGFGEDTNLVPLVMGTFAVGLVFDDERSKDAAVAALPAVILGQTVVEILKSATHRKRPNSSESPYVFEGPAFGSDNTSFPSGHSAAAWSVATVFAEQYKHEHPWSPYLAYGLAALTSYSRVYKNRHWMSDVTLGAIVGHVTAKIALKWYQKYLQDSVHSITLYPTFGGGTYGFSLEIRKKVFDSLNIWSVDKLYKKHQLLYSNEEELSRIYNQYFTY